MIKIGICGLGFVGNAILNFLNKQHYHVFIYDKYKDINEFAILLETDILFLCLPTPYNPDTKKYDTREIDCVLEKLNTYKGNILIKSTVLPFYCIDANNLYPQLKIIHNPEFLSARTAEIDFEKQTHIVLGYTEQSKHMSAYMNTFYTKLFPLAKISNTTSEYSALMKLACNSFYATKIQFFTELYLLCDNMNISYDKLKGLMLANDWINPQHTNVPGHDHFISFGGACFPKDISALNEFMHSIDTPRSVINAVITERNKMRDD
jgi:UDPglucose 6-dehydrogenase